MKNKKEKELLLEHLKKVPIIQIACEKVGISRATYYRWRKENKKFSNLADEAILEGSRLINDLAESQLMSAIRDKNMTAIIFWLKYHHPSYTTRVEVMAHLKQSNDELTSEQKSLIEQALKLAALSETNLLINNQKIYDKESEEETIEQQKELPEPIEPIINKPTTGKTDHEENN